MSEQEIIDKLTQNLSPKRLNHSMGVGQAAVRLAERYGADPEKARLAGILHDCARDIPKINLLKMAEAFGIVVDSVERRELVLLHAKVGAVLAQAEYGVNDAEICRAIALHTTGGPDMTILDKVIFLADYIEPGRNFPGVDNLRLYAETDFKKALIAAYDQTLQYIIAQRGLIHPATLDGRNALLLES